MGGIALKPKVMQNASRVQKVSSKVLLFVLRYYLLEPPRTPLQSLLKSNKASKLIWNEEDEDWHQPSFK